MKKIIYITSILVYAAIGALGMQGGSYIEVGSDEKIFKNNFLILMVVALLLGATAIAFFIKIFPTVWGKLNKLSRFFILSLFIILSVLFTGGLFLFINTSVGSQTVIKIKGVIEKKWYTRGSKGRADYYLGLRDSISQKYYEFKVKEHVYDQVGNRGNRIDKIFYKGSLGVIFRYSY